jgi:hypothetical protein
MAGLRLVIVLHLDQPSTGGPAKKHFLTGIIPVVVPSPMLHFHGILSPYDLAEECTAEPPHPVSNFDHTGERYGTLMPMRSV